MKESKIESEVCKYAELRGILQYKFNSESNNGVPDRIFLRRSKIFFIEFKATGKLDDVSALQKDIHEELRKQGFEVYVIDDIEDGKKVINEWLENYITL
jgi:G:T-mismatch repair DNA endonuclease (very short patch repair protein)